MGQAPFVKEKADTIWYRLYVTRLCRGVRLEPAQMAGGSPPRCFSASNIQKRSKPLREACNSQQEFRHPL